DLDREIDVTWRVDDIDSELDAVTCPECSGRGRRDRDAALLLLLHPVHRRGAFMHLADLVLLAGIVKNTLGRGRLTGIDVSHDADVPVVIERRCACHIYPSGVSRGGRAVHSATPA